MLSSVLGEKILQTKFGIQSHKVTKLSSEYEGTTRLLFISRSNAYKNIICDYRLEINKHLKVEATPVSRKILTVNQFICFVLQESGEERIVLGIRISLYHSRKFLGIK